MIKIVYHPKYETTSVLKKVGVIEVRMKKIEIITKFNQINSEHEKISFVLDYYISGQMNYYMLSDFFGGSVEEWIYFIQSFNIKFCPKCQKCYPLSFFKKSLKRKDKKHISCKLCNSKRNKINIEKIRQILDDYDIFKDIDSQMNIILELYKNGIDAKFLSQLFDKPMIFFVNFFKEKGVKYSPQFDILLPRSFFDNDSNRIDGKFSYPKFYRYKNKDIIIDILREKLDPFKHWKEQEELIIELYSKNATVEVLSSLFSEEPNNFIKFFKKLNISYCSKCKRIYPMTFFRNAQDMLLGKESFCRLHLMKSENKDIIIDILREKLDPFKHWKEQEELIIELYSMGFQYRQFASIFGEKIQTFVDFFKEKDIKYCSVHKCLHSRDEFDQRKSKNFTDGLLSYCKKAPVLFDKFYEKIEKIEECRRDPNNSSFLQIRCKFCNKWFNPTYDQIKDRINAINGKSSSPGTQNYLYCSQQCKINCILYRSTGQVTNNKSKRNTSYNKTLRKMRIEYVKKKYDLINSIYVKCESNECIWGPDMLFTEDEVENHHIVPVSQDYLLEFDLDNCRILCKDCHNNIHKNNPGCKTSELIKISKEDVC